MYVPSFLRILIPGTRSIGNKANAAALKQARGSHRDNMWGGDAEEQDLQFILFTSLIILDVEVYHTKWYTVVETNGPIEYFFVIRAAVVQRATHLYNTTTSIDVNTHIEHWNRADNITIVKNPDFSVAYNNGPAEDNVLTSNAPVATDNGLYSGNIWDLGRFYQHCCTTPHNAKPGFRAGCTPLGKTWLDIFVFVPDCVVTQSPAEADVSRFWMLM
jgi:hypothetical protein